MHINLDLLQEIRELQFAVIETILYLNTHPRDRNVLELHNDLARSLMNKMHRYQEEYGPLVPTYPEADYPWQWINEPWPWQIEY
jgi:spore coat protein JB